MILENSNTSVDMAIHLDDSDIPLKDCFSVEEFRDILISYHDKAFIIVDFSGIGLLDDNITPNILRFKDAIKEYNSKILLNVSADMKDSMLPVVYKNSTFSIFLL